MKELRIRLAVPTSLMMVGLFLVSCTSHTLKTSELSPALFRSPLHDLSPRTFAFREFVDIRDVEDPTRMMKGGAHTFYLEDPPTILVAQWIQNELERNGHKCVPYSPSTKADFVVEGTVFKFSVRQYPASFTSITMSAETGIKLTISRTDSDPASLTKSYQARRDLTEVAFTIKTTFDLWKPAINQALVAMIQDMSTDSELMAFLAK